MPRNLYGPACIRANVFKQPVTGGAHFGLLQAGIPGVGQVSNLP